MRFHFFGWSRCRTPYVTMLASAEQNRNVVGSILDSLQDIPTAALTYINA